MQNRRVVAKNYQLREERLAQITDLTDREIYCKRHATGQASFNYDVSSLNIQTALSTQLRYSEDNISRCNQQLRGGPEAEKSYSLDQNAVSIQGALKASRARSPSLSNSGQPHIDSDAIFIQRPLGAQMQLAKRPQNFGSMTKHNYHPLLMKKKEMMYAEQEKLESKHRQEEDTLLAQFKIERERQAKKWQNDEQEEWEQKLLELTRKFDREYQSSGVKMKEKDARALTLRFESDKEDMERRFHTASREKNSFLTLQLRKKEQHATSEMVKRHGTEMLELIQNVEQKIQKEMAAEIYEMHKSGVLTNGVAPNGSVANQEKLLPPPAPQRIPIKSGGVKTAQPVLVGDDDPPPPAILNGELKPPPTRPTRISKESQPHVNAATLKDFRKEKVTIQPTSTKVRTWGGRQAARTEQDDAVAVELVEKQAANGLEAVAPVIASPPQAPTSTLPQTNGAINGARSASALKATEERTGRTGRTPSSYSKPATIENVSSPTKSQPTITAAVTPSRWKATTQKHVSAVAQSHHSKSLPEGADNAPLPESSAITLAGTHVKEHFDWPSQDELNSRLGSFGSVENLTQHFEKTLNVNSPIGGGAAPRPYLKNSSASNATKLSPTRQFPKARAVSQGRLASTREEPEFPLRTHVTHDDDETDGFHASQHRTSLPPQSAYRGKLVQDIVPPANSGGPVMHSKSVIYTHKNRAVSAGPGSRYSRTESLSPNRQADSNGRGRPSRYSVDRDERSDLPSANGYGDDEVPIRKSRNFETYTARKHSPGYGLGGGQSIQVSNNFPPPHPPVCSKKDLFIDASVFAEVDAHVISVATSGAHDSFTELVRQLTGHLRNDLEKVRAIFRWVTVKDLNQMVLSGQEKADTPIGLLRGIKYGSETYHALFMRLCSYAGIPCVEIRGHSKSVGYQPGLRFESDHFINTWNSVLIDGDWRLIQCNWGARHLVANREKNGVVEQIPERENYTAAASPDNSAVRYQYDEHYFLTDPHEFIQEFWPFEEAWQLLDEPITKKQFEDMPFVRSIFFHCGMKIISEPKAVLHANDRGGIEIQLTHDADLIDKLVFHYKLRSLDHTDHSLPSDKLSRYVFQGLTDNKLVYTLHVPKAGAYLLEVFANRVDRSAIQSSDFLHKPARQFTLKCACKFKLIAETIREKMHPLPKCAPGEWGPSKARRQFGMIAISHKAGAITTDQPVSLKFATTQALHFTAKLRSNRYDGVELEKHLSLQVDDTIMCVQVDFPGDGQYGVDIFAREASGVSDTMLTHACKYLLNVVNLKRGSNGVEQQQQRSSNQGNHAHHNSSEKVPDFPRPVTSDHRVHASSYPATSTSPSKNTVTVTRVPPAYSAKLNSLERETSRDEISSEVLTMDRKSAGGDLPRISSKPLGPSPHFNLLGLKTVTHHSPSIQTESSLCKLTMELSESVYVSFQFHNTNGTPVDKKKCVTMSAGENRRINFDVVLPERGCTYELSMFARRPTDQKGNSRLVYRYSISRT